MARNTEENQIQGFWGDVLCRLFGMGYLSETFPPTTPPPPNPPLKVGILPYGHTQTGQ